MHAAVRHNIAIVADRDTVFCGGEDFAGNIQGVFGFIDFPGFQDGKGIIFQMIVDLRFHRVIRNDRILNGNITILVGVCFNGQGKGCGGTSGGSSLGLRVFNAWFDGDG